MPAKDFSDELNNALVHHQAGRLDAATVLYEKILAENSLHTDAMHLLGVAALQSGNPDRAVDLISKAVVLNPREASFYCNLGEAYRALEKLDLAAESYKTALQLHPRYADAANNLGLALAAQQKNHEAAAWFRNAIRFNPDHAMAHNNLGNLLVAQRDFAAAIAAFREAIRCAPTLAEAHSNLGQALLEERQLSEALIHCREAVRLRPNFAAARNNLGNVLRDTDQLQAAKNEYAEALRLDPQNALTCNNIAQALQQENALEDAVSWYQRALKLDAKLPRIHANYASALAEQEKCDEAIERFQKSLSLDPEFAEAHAGLGAVYFERSEFELAKQHLKRALEAKPNLSSAHCTLGSIYEELGDFQAAEMSLREALKHNPDCAGAFGHLATMLKNKLPKNDRQHMEKLLENPELPPTRASVLHFGLAHVCDSQGEYDSAARHLEIGHFQRRSVFQKQGMAYIRAEHTKFVDDLQQVFTHDFFTRTKGFGSESERPVFIVGLPRSGTTLTEQVLASHAKIYGAGETRLVSDDVKAIPQLSGCGALPIECTKDITKDVVQKLSAQHLEALEKMNVDALRVVDKMPDNYLNLGLIALMFPQAKIIHCRRDLRDVAVSCWNTNFGAIRWNSDFEDIAARFREYRRIMAHWNSVLPVTFFEVHYADMVSDLESVARRIVDFVGLDWDENCLNFHQKSRPIRTASVTQVRQPIYTRSVDRWKNYEKHLAPLFERITTLSE